MQNTVLPIVVATLGILVGVLLTTIYQPSRVNARPNNPPFTYTQCASRCRADGNWPVSYNPYSSWVNGTPVSDSGETSPCLCKS